MSVEYAILRAATTHLCNPGMGKFKTEKLRILVEQFCSNFTEEGYLPKYPKERLPIRWKRFYITQKLNTMLVLHDHYLLVDRFTENKFLLTDIDKTYLKNMSDFLNYYWELVRYNL